VTRRRYAVIGTGDRALEMYVRPLAGPYADVAELVGLCDPNPIRAAAVAELAGVPGVRRFEDAGSMLDAVAPDAVIVTSKDVTHDAYIVQALRAGCDVITEKPLAIDDQGCRSILQAVEETGRHVRVTFNYRYAPVFTEMKRLLTEGVVGDVRSVDFHWYLDRSHGADYFRRWHRRRANSGGLFVHKATHHFDLVNWWLAERPEAVLAEGALLVYGASGPFRGERCRGCEHAPACEFWWDVGDDEEYRRLYLDAEPADGYQRDGCVFDLGVDIFDTMAAIVRYRGGVRMSDSLNAYCAYEGMRAALNGTDGRLEIEVIESRHVPNDELRVYRYGSEEPIHVVLVPRDGEGHGGGDERLLDDLFRGGPDDPLGHTAGVLDGALSVLVGVAANRSADTGGWARIDDLLEGAG
jgi:predicted dehydrogenase